MLFRIKEKTTEIKMKMKHCNTELSINRNTLLIPGRNCFITGAPCKHRNEKKNPKYIRKEESTLKKCIQYAVHSIE